MNNTFWPNSQYQTPNGRYLAVGPINPAAAAPNLPSNPNNNGQGGSNGFNEGRGSDSGGRARAWACPFFKHNKHQHQDCRAKRFRHIADVRLHLQRCHSEPPVHCPTCKRVFQGSNKRRKRDDHIVERQCPVNNQASLIRVTPELSGRLHGMSNYGADSEERRWYSIWEELFGRNTPYPDSCYHLISATSELINDAAETFIGQGDAIDQLITQVQQEIYITYGPRSLVDRQILSLIAHRTVAAFREYYAQNEGTIGMRSG
ncbi:hypothetical protein QBC38DRAFT_492532 [Podospora fimiseda]|uniref:C2H2-type domain-containing protein n=1 Tax=Podospora fimiseda TaxID=252190 RepID=A0AAN6YKY7_9PEZI|nr:hypothetical protein QBC38DRAFT_492532 [Podospora fimiseda]